ncbi:MAG: hypothetical protein HY378_00930 [Candidatus Brennerbacteria bacterium]|nr:hypothetical protein [Candidatus Brennerbacteria bacterium]
MNSETKICQNCKSKFVIEPEDFKFYEKIKVPPPTFCPECRFQRRLMFRNERVFYKRDCELCGKNVIALFAPERGRRVYCQPCWWGDGWDGTDYGMDYDPNRNFFEQLKELSLKTPYMSLITDYSTLVNSDYVNHAGTMKNCYLTFNADYCENVAYGVLVDYAKDSLDVNIFGESELCYEAINCGKCFNTFFSEDCTSCTDVYFSKDCVGCSHCFGCAGLRNKKYHWFNESISKDEFERRLAAANLSSRKSLSETIAKTRDYWLKFPRKFYHGKLNKNVSGDYVYQSKNAHYMYQARAIEDSKYCQFITLPSAKDVYDLTEWGAGAELICDSITAGGNSQNIYFCFASWSGAVNTQYCMYTPSCQNLFGCVNLKKKQYCILNKQYTKQEYEKLQERILTDTEKSPYIDKTGRAWKYGEFLPYDLSPFAYNESTAMQYWSLNEEETKKKGWEWQKPAKSSYQVTMPPEKIPDSIEEVDDSVLKEILACESCGKAFRLIPLELQLLKKFGFPVPRKCPDCRHMERMSRVNPPRLWRRKCAKCGKEIQTSYSPERPEIVYCEECYQSEVM